jgi:D-3-phosphoglycerate dehydrogenase
MRVLVTEPLSEPGLQILREAAHVDVRPGLTPDDLAAVIGEYDGLVVRSATQVTAALLEAGCQLRVVGRAGTGVDNIDVAAATRRGVVVVNAPAANSNAVAEHTIALMLAMARRIYPAVASLKAGHWEKRVLEGFEVRDKTLGLVGLGRVGMLVASKARGLQMRVVAHDPYVSPERVASAGVELATLEDVLRRADFISVHTPLSPDTRGMIGARELAMLKPTAYLLNCARGGIVNEGALRQALERGELAGTALDVFEEEPAMGNPLIELPNVIATPHLGASTAEAQEHVAVDVAHAVVDVLAGRIPEGPVNLPYVPAKAVEFLQPYIDLASRLGSFFVQWRGELLGRLELVYEGDICGYDTRVLTSAFLAGLLAPVSDGPVNLVNAAQRGEERGLVVSEARLGPGTRFGSLITARFPDRHHKPAPERMDISGALIQGEPHLVGLDGQRLDCVAAGRMLVDLHHDRPGIVGRMGQILGRAEINIAFVQMSRVARGGPSIMILGLDESVPPDLMPRFLEVPNVQRVCMVNLPPYNGYLEGEG